MMFFAEYDECTSLDGHGCEHECINTLGDYKCRCQIGYELHSDEKRCESKPFYVNNKRFRVLRNFCSAMLWKFEFADVKLKTNLHSDDKKFESKKVFNWIVIGCVFRVNFVA